MYNELLMFLKFSARMSVLPINLLYQGVVVVTTKVVTSNLGHGKVYSIQHYVIKFVSDLRQVGGFLHQ
jgi:hypothetical protein